MFGIEWLSLGHVLTFGYIAIGLIVAFFYMKKQDMTQPIRDANADGIIINAGNFAFFFLVVIWPLLVPLMLLPYFQDPPPKSDTQDRD